jgi:hypothetical protein
MREPLPRGDNPVTEGRARGAVWGTTVIAGLALVLALATGIWVFQTATRPARRLQRAALALQALEAQILPELQVEGSPAVRPAGQSGGWLAEGTVRNASDHAVTRIRLLGVFSDAAGRETGRGEIEVPPVLPLHPGERCDFTISSDHGVRPARCDVRVLGASPLLPWPESAKAEGSP